jgi:hypothetical protein
VTGLLLNSLLKKVIYISTAFPASCVDFQTLIYSQVGLFSVCLSVNT